MTLSVVLALIVAVSVLADYGARGVAEGLVRDRIVSALALPAGSEPAVDLGPGSLIGQALSGRINSVAVSVAQAPVGELTGDLRIVATGIPLDVNQSMTGLTVQFSIAASELEPFGALVVTAPIESITLAESSIMVSSPATLYGVSVPVVASLSPSVRDGQLILTATDISVGGAKLSLEAATQGPLSALLQPLISPQPLCLAQYLPRAVILQAAAVVNQSLVLDFAANNVVLSDGSLTALGSCQ